MHRIWVKAANEKGEIIGKLEDALLFKGDEREFQNPQYNPEFLRNLAEKTGGKFFELDQLSRVADEIPWGRHEEVEVIQIRLWHFPGFYFFLVLAMVVEWYVRRRKGQA